VTQECRKDKELVLKAVKKDVGSLQFAPQEQWIGLPSTCSRLFLQWILVLLKSQVNMPAMTRLTRLDTEDPIPTLGLIPTKFLRSQLGTSN
jgi:hypothetical protein